MTPEKPLPAWKAASRERLCEAVLDAARVTFGEKGYDGATVEEIAARAEVGKGTVYNYFEGGKPALFAAVASGAVATAVAYADRRVRIGAATARRTDSSSRMRATARWLAPSGSEPSTRYGVCPYPRISDMSSSAGMRANWSSTESDLLESRSPLTMTF